MGDTIRKVDYFHVNTPNKAGEGAKVLAALWESGVNLLAFTGFPSGKNAQIDLVPEDTESLKKAAKKAGLKLSVKKTGFLVQGSDRVGAIAEILSEMAAAKINVTAIDAVTAGEGRYGAIFWVKTSDVKKTAKTLGAFQKQSVISKEAIVGYIKKSIPDADINLIDKTGMMDHYCLEITSEKFKGMTLLDRNRSVYQALNEPMGDGRIHALEIRSRSREE